MVELKVFLAFLIVLFISAQGFAQPCTLSAITMNITKTGRVVKGQPELEVAISNNCICTQSYVVVRCNGFSSVEPVNPAIFKKYQGGCLLNNGQPIFQGEPFKFKFAGRVPTTLIPISSQINCS